MPSPNFNEWLQSSNPATDSTIEGYEPVTITYGADDNANPLFRGLGRDDGSNAEKCAIDHTPKVNKWYFCIGVLNLFNGGIPGPSLDALNYPRNVRLYAKRTDKQGELIRFYHYTFFFFISSLLHL